MSDKKNPIYRADLSKKDYHKLTGFEGDWRDTWWNDEFLAMMAEQWQLDKVKTMLDVGCGVGHWGQRLMRHLGEDTKMYGVDPEAAWLNKAKERAQKLGIANRSEFRVGTAEQLPFENNSVDMITCQTLLIHVPNLQKALQEMIRVLKPNGLLLCAEPNNFGNSAANYVQNPLMSWEDLSQLLELDYLCTKGKFELGEGHQSAGHLIPAALRDCGWTDINIHSNNQCAVVQPPYTDLSSRSWVKLLKDCYDSDAAMVLGGTRKNCLRFYLAGGGDKARFTNLWELARKHLAKMVETIDKGSYISAGGHIHYLVWGHKK